MCHNATTRFCSACGLISGQLSERAQCFDWPCGEASLYYTGMPLHGNGLPKARNSALQGPGILNLIKPLGSSPCSLLMSDSEGSAMQDERAGMEEKTMGLKLQRGKGWRVERGECEGGLCSDFKSHSQGQGAD